MGRQRTINDRAFWRSPRLQNSTLEDKVANLHLLTAPDSNIIGSYCLVPRIAAAEIKITEDHWLQLMKSLEKQDLAQYDFSLMFVWVKNWWDHHNPRQTMGPKLRDRTIEEIKNLPEFCRDGFICDFRQRISRDHQKLLDESLHPVEMLNQTQYGYDMDTLSNFSIPNSNINTNINSNSKKTSTIESPSSTNVGNTGIPETYRHEVNQALDKAQQNGLIRAEPQQVIDELARQFKSSNPPRSPGAMAYFLAQHLQINKPTNSIENAEEEELPVLKGRCFAWPLDNPTSYARVGDFGQFELFCREDGQFLRRVGMLNNCDLLKAIRANHVREISASSLDGILLGEMI